MPRYLPLRRIRQRIRFLYSGLVSLAQARTMGI
jgi:hypothetical protein